MPQVNEPVAITAIYGQPREGMHSHVFVGANFVMQGMLNAHRDELSVAAQPSELSEAAARTRAYLETEAARVSIRGLEQGDGKVGFEVLAENLGGHKLPTAYPARRAWLHVTVYDRDGKGVFESGALNKDGSIVGNDNDADSRRFEPHYREITRSDEVEIYESILKDAQGRVTTGLLSAVEYYKDNRLLPAGFDKTTASNHVKPVGDAMEDPGFTGKGSVVQFAVRTNAAAGPFAIEVQLMYQPIVFRWAHNLGAYDAAEPKRFVGYFDEAANSSAVVLATARVVQ